MPPTIAQFVTNRITTVGDLQDALQLAMQLEFSTIPPYLCAEWSINDDPNDVTDIIHAVVIQEMYHFATAGNLLSAIGGTPKIAYSGFLPSYPTHTLPGGIAQALAVDLQPLSATQLQVFMQIEMPEFGPVALIAEAGPPPATIGAFYDTISAGFTAVNPAINVNANAILVGPLKRVNTVADAIAAIAAIKQEGEGTPASPDEPASDNGQLAHYYLFKEVLKGNQLVQVDGSWEFSGPAIQMPTVYPFGPKAPVDGAPDPSLAFNQTLVTLLTGLQACWTSGQPFNRSDMDTLAQLGTGLIQGQGVRPTFEWPN